MNCKMFVAGILIMSCALGDSTLSSSVQTQQLSYGRSIRSIRQLSDSTEDQNSGTEMNIAFELPDIATAVDLPYGAVQLEAFKSVNNDRNLQDLTRTKASQLFWVSVGHPHFVKTLHQENTNDTKDSELFHFSNRGFSTYIEMMTREQRRALAAAAASKYQVNVSDHQIVHLVLSKFLCTLLLYDEAGDKFLITGNVSDFRYFPLRIDFEAHPKSTERRLFTQFIKQSVLDFDFDCHIESSGGKLVKSNTLSINSAQMQQIGLEEKLFGPAGSNGTENVYVTRNQMTDLAYEMYSALNIVEDYQMPESQFSEAFVTDLIAQLSTTQFAQVPIDSVLASLSKYGFDVSGDFQPDVIKRDAGSILKVENYNNKSHIVVDQSNYNAISDSTSVSGGFRGSFFGLFKTSINAAVGMSKSSASKNRKLSDQLQELNAASHNEAKWEIEGTKIVPKTLNVARLTRSKIKTTLTFNRIRLQTFHAPFERNFKMYTLRSPSFKAPGKDDEKLLQNFFKDLSANFQVVAKKLEKLENQTYDDDLQVLTQKVEKLINQSSEDDFCRNSIGVCDCYTIRTNGQTRSGVYRIYVDHLLRRYYTNVYCDMTTGIGGWTIFQRRKDGSVDFYRGWSDYVDGFGNLDGEFWLGNDLLHLLTSKRSYRLRIDMEDFAGNRRYAEYSTFAIGPSSGNYRLTISGYSGTAGGDSFTYHNGQQFSTKDGGPNPSCARSIYGAWWYVNCHAYSSLNGRYVRESQSPGSYQGILWYHWRSSYTYSLKASEMKIIPVI